jgi:2-polyprenyl-3-methyl-5-hydroxy-6-metoxy-1,4-benzoquinol methylase
MKNQLDACPVCLSDNLQKNYFTSREGYLSLPGYSHSLCVSCGSVLLDPRPSKEELELFYQSQAHESVIESDARDSTNRILDKHRYAYFYEHRIMPLIQFIDRNKLIFDVGCGTGCFVKAMKDLGYSARGSDVSQISIQVGRDSFGLNEHELMFGDLHNINLDKLGCVTLWTVIEHLRDPVEYLQFLHSKLDSGGILLMEFPTVDSLMFHKFKQDFFWVMPPYHIFIYSVEGAKIMLKRAGFELLLEHRMPSNWNFFEVMARKSGMSQELIHKLKIEVPNFSKEIDILLDDIALDHGQSSSVQLIARKK